MDTPAPTTSLRFNPWLPYWAVFQMDIRQTLRSWLFRIWILTALILSVGYLMHRAAVHHQAGILQSSATFVSELLQFALLVGTSLVVVLTAGTISAERGTMADSVLSRGISRYQYFLGKWHSRLVTTLGSFFFIGAGVVVGSCFLLQADLSILGSFMALAVVTAVLAIVVSCGVTMSSLCNSTVLGIAILWMGIYGLGLALALLGYGQLNPLRLLRLLPALIAGQYDTQLQGQLIGWCALASLGAAVVGLLHFSRRDV